MTEINTNIQNLSHAIEQMEKNKEINHIQVWKSDCVIRNLSFEEMKERNIVDRSERICTFRENSLNILEMNFHQNQIDDDMEFNFRPPHVQEINAGNYHTPVRELGAELEQVVSHLEDLYNYIGWDLAEINGGSYAQGGHITSFEFTFELVCSR